MIRIPKIGDVYCVKQNIIFCASGSTVRFGNYAPGEVFSCVGVGYFSYQVDDFNYNGWWAFSITGLTIGFYPITMVELQSESTLDLEQNECVCDNITLMRDGCVCGSIKRYKS